MEMCRRLEIEVVDVLPSLVEFHREHEEEPLFFEKDWHLTPLGHRVLATELYERFDARF